MSTPAEEPAPNAWERLRHAVLAFRVAMRRRDLGNRKAVGDLESLKDACDAVFREARETLENELTDAKTAAQAAFEERNKEADRNANASADDLQRRVDKLRELRTELGLTLRQYGWSEISDMVSPFQPPKKLATNVESALMRALDQANRQYNELLPLAETPRPSADRPPQNQSGGLFSALKNPLANLRGIIYEASGGGEHREKLGGLFRTFCSRVDLAQYLVETFRNEASNYAESAIAASREEMESEITLREEIFTRKLKRADQERRRKLTDALKLRQEAANRDKDTLDHALAALREEAKDLVAEAAASSPPWDDENAWVATRGKEAERFRIGELIEDYGEGEITLPMLLPVLRRPPIVVQTSGVHDREVALAGVQAMALRLMLNLPPGKLRFTFIDPVSLGQNVARFMDLTDHDEALVGGKIWTEKLHIEQRLVDLTEHVATVIQKYLRSEFVDIEAFNEAAGDVAEPYRVLVVFDFPHSFTDDAIDRLRALMLNGPRCGVYTLIHQDLNHPVPRRLGDSFAKSAIALRGDGHYLHPVDPVLAQSRCELDTPPDDSCFREWVRQVGEAAMAANTVEVLYRDVLQRVGFSGRKYWGASTVDGVKVPLGPVGAKKMRFLELGKGTAQHALIGGKTGSGKSTLLHVLIIGMALKYSPDELELYLIDFKKGVEFKQYVTHQVPHVRVVAVESEREFGLSVLEGLDAELERRGRLFRGAGVEDIRGYRKKTEELLPRIVMLVDEFQEFFAEDDLIATKVSQILDRLVRQGRAFGVHVLMGSQTLAGTYMLARSTFEQMAIRIALQCSEADSRMLLAEDNAAARLLSRPGEAIYNDQNGLIEGNEPFQVAWLGEDAQNSYLTALAELRTAHNCELRMVTFEGNMPSNLHANRTFAELSTREGDILLLGQPISVEDACLASFKQQNGSNLLLVGQDPDASLAIFLSALLSLIRCRGKDHYRMHIIDFGPRDGLGAERFGAVQELAEDRISYGRNRDFLPLLTRLHQEMQERNEQEHASMSPVFVAIHGLQRARDLAPYDDFGGAIQFAVSDSPAPASPGQMFGDLLRDGPDVGIHLLVWCDSQNNINRRMSAQTVREFEMRIVFQMSLQDSLALIDSPLAAKLGGHRALFVSDDEGRLDKFKPFALPNAEWIRGLK